MDPADCIRLDPLADDACHSDLCRRAHSPVHPDGRFSDRTVRVLAVRAADHRAGRVLVYGVLEAQRPPVEAEALSLVERLRDQVQVRVHRSPEEDGLRTRHHRLFRHMQNHHDGPKAVLGDPYLQVHSCCRCPFHTAEVAEGHRPRTHHLHRHTTQKAGQSHVGGHTYHDRSRWQEEEVHEDRNCMGGKGREGEDRIEGVGGCLGDKEERNRLRLR